MLNKWKIAAVVIGLLSPQGAVRAESAKPVAPANSPVDETALRYYASLRQTDRVEVESRRLKKQNPNWTPPADLWTAKPGGPEEAPLWAMFTADDIAGLKVAIAKMQKQDPAWGPSDDLTRKLRMKELRMEIVAAVAQEDWEKAEKLSAAVNNDSLDVALAWMLAEVFVKRDRIEDAEKMYALILQRNTMPQERVATIEKALGNLPIGNIEHLLLLAKSSPDGKSEFSDLATDITRARIAGCLRDQSRSQVPDAELVAFQAYARASTGYQAAGLLAWYALKRNDLQEALTWFKAAISHGGDAMVAHGLAHTLRRLGAEREAEEVAYAWREPLINNSILFIDLMGEELTRESPVVIEPARLARFAQVTMMTASGEGAQALGWYAYNACQFEMALAWFQRATAWFPKETTVYGYALTLQRLKRRPEFIEVVNRYDGLFPKVVGLLFSSAQSESTPSCGGARNQAQRDDQGKISPIRNLGIDSRPAAWAQIPDPSRNADPRMSGGLVKRSEFPLAVSSENALRFTAFSDASNDGARMVWRENTAGAAPRVARRVPGVGAMPYEALGYTLRPGWDGTDRPTSPDFAERPAIVGTLWAEQMQTSLRNPGSRAGSTASSPFERMRTRLP